MRITQKNLEALVERLNQSTGQPVTSYTKEASGKYRANIGNYHLDYAYGGVSLHQMQSEGGGIRDVFQRGHRTKRELWDMMHAYLAGIESGRK